MKIEVNSTFLYKLFNDFVKQQHLMCNFTTDGNYLSIQVLDDYTAVTSLSVTSIDGDHSIQSISVWIPAFIHAMSDKENVYITITDVVLYLEQSTFNCTLIREYEERRSLPTAPTELKPAFANRLKYLTHSAISCNAMAKELAIPNPDPMIVDGKFYLNYNQAAFIDSIQYPNICIPYPTLSKFVFRLDENATYAYLPDIETLYFRSGIYEFWVPVTNYNININIINTLESLRANSTDITTVMFSRYKPQLESIITSLPKSKVMLAFGNSKFRVIANGNSVNAYIGDDIDDVLLATYITTAQLSSILKLFANDDNEITTVRKGVKNICLVSGEKTLMIAETIS